ncbi:hypothetical protein [Endozoicomonas sp. ALE010]|uniref:hypothetical protein n=1 Tax=Endozoicomonas sp. ALE010 TaxID=3403081 RepID=UPI003BB4FACA
MDNCFVSVVINGFCLDDFESKVFQLHQYLQERFSDFEILIIDSPGKVDIDIIIHRLLVAVSSIRYIRLTSDVDLDVMVAAGLENSIGDFVLCFDLEHDPIFKIHDFVKSCRSGGDIVVGTTEVSTSFAYRCIRPLVTSILKDIGYGIPRNATGLLCFSRRAINSITESGRFHHKLYVKISQSGYKISRLEYKLVEGKKIEKTFSKGFKESFQYLVFNSTKPLRWMSVVGLSASIISLFVASYSLIINLFKNNVVAGWTTTIIFLSVMFIFLFTIMAFFGEYIARLLDDRSEHKDYSIVYEKNSSVMLNENRFNVLFDSVESDVNLVQTGRKS